MSAAIFCTRAFILSTIVASYGVIGVGRGSGKLWNIFRNVSLTAALVSDVFILRPSITACNSWHATAALDICDCWSSSGRCLEYHCSLFCIRCLSVVALRHCRKGDDTMQTSEIFILRTVRILVLVGRFLQVCVLRCRIGR